MNFQYCQMAMSSQQSHPEQSNDPPLQVSLDVALLGIAVSPPQQKKSKFSQQEAIEELKESSSDQKESNISFQEENLSSNSFFQNQENEVFPSKKMVMSARIVDKE